MADFRSGTRIGRYEVVGPAIHGGMASLYAVRRHDLKDFDRLFALKAMHPHLASDANFLDMFKDEAAIAARIQHSNVVHVFETGVHDGLPYLVMEMLSGRTLHEVIRTGGALDPAIALYIIAEVAAALSAVHSACDSDGTPLNVVHRDVNPSNIHIGYDGGVHLLDFGVASANRRRAKTSTGEVKGKVSYLAPEQMHGDVAAPTMDLFALGVTAWESLTGRRLFAAPSNAQTLWNVLHHPVPSLAKENVGVSAEAAAIIMQCLERSPAARPKNADVVLEAMLSGAGHRRLLAQFMDRLFPIETRVTLGASAAAEPAEAAPRPTDPRPEAAIPASEPTVLRPASPENPAPKRVWALVTAMLLGVAAAGAYALSVEETPPEESPASPSPVLAVDGPGLVLPQPREVRPSADEAGVDEPVVDEPSVDEPSVDEPSVDETPTEAQREERSPRRTRRRPTAMSERVQDSEMDATPMRGGLSIQGELERLGMGG